MGLMVPWRCASAGGPRLSPPLDRPECWEEKRSGSYKHPPETPSPQPSLSLGTNLVLGDVWLPQGAQHHVALVHKLLPTHLALQPALGRSLTQAVPLHNASYSLGRQGIHQPTGLEQDAGYSGDRVGGGIQIPQSQG